MNNEISKTQIDTYNDLGYVVIENLLSNDELECWRTAVDTGIDQHISKKMHNNQNPALLPRNVLAVP